MEKPITHRNIFFHLEWMWGSIFVAYIERYRRLYFNPFTFWTACVTLGFDDARPTHMLAIHQSFTGGTV